METQFSLGFAGLNILLVAISALIASREKRLTKDQIGPCLKNIPWTCHAGMWADLTLMSIIMGFVLPYWPSWSGSSIIISLFISLIVTAVCHVFWAKIQLIPGHIVDPTKKGLKKLLIGGWYHIVYMTFCLAAILLFYLASTPAASHLLGVSVFLSIFVVPATLQPDIQEFEGGGNIIGWAVSIVLWGIIWLTFVQHLNA